MRLLLIHPAHDFSTSDLCRGIRGALAAQGVELVDYRLSSRLEVINSGLRASWIKPEPPSMDLIADLASQGLAHLAAISEPDWALIISGMGLHPNAVYALRRIGLRVACWFTESPYNRAQERRFAALCDIAFINERSELAAYQAAVAPGGRAVYLPHAYDPTVHRPDGPLPIDADRADVLFVGTGFENRQIMCENVDWTALGARPGGVHLRGLWPGVYVPNHLATVVQQGCIANEETARLYRGAKVMINLHRGHPTAESMNPRTLEVAACGAFQVADRRAEVADVFGDSVPLFDADDPWELAFLLRRALADPPWRTACAAEARRRVAPHTFEARARRILETLSGYDGESGGEVTPFGAATSEYVPSTASPTPAAVAA